MARIHFPAVEEMSTEQRAAYEEAARGPRGHAPAPMAAWMLNPEFARRAQKLGEYVRFHLDLPSNLRELAVLLVARHWAAHHEWRIHKKEAIKHGVSAHVVEAITAQRTPEFTSEVERVVYDLANSILQRRQVPAELYGRGLEALGERGVAELIGVIGYYTFVSITLVAFEIGLPESLQPELLNP